MMVPMNKTIKISLILLSPAAFLVILEILLRVFGFAPHSRNEIRLDWGSARDAELGYVLIPGAVGPGGEGAQSINRLGFRGEEISREKSEGTFRILALGGSTTYGVEVHNDETWPAILQAELNCDRFSSFDRVEVVNAGVCGYLSDHHLFRLRRELLELRPDMIIVMSGLNDIASVLAPSPVSEARRKNNVLAAETSDVIVLRRWLSSHSAFFNLFEGAIEKAVASIQRLISGEEGLRLELEESLTIYESNLDEMIRLCRENHVSFVLVGYPWIFDFRFGPPDNYADLVRRYDLKRGDFDILWEGAKRLKDINAGYGDRDGARHLDVQKVFDQVRDRYSLYVPGDYIHPNKQGNFVIANAIRRFLLNDVFKDHIRTRCADIELPLRYLLY